MLYAATECTWEFELDKDNLLMTQIKQSMIKKISSPR